MTASSNFGNVFSVLVASAFLPFLPMLPVQLLTVNLLYDFSQASIPWDDMDPEYLTRPAPVARRRHRAVHGLHRPDQLDLRHLHVRPDVVRVRRQRAGASDALSVRLVHRIVTHADADRAHDPHGESAVHPEPGHVAGARDDRRDHRCWIASPVRGARTEARTRAAAVELFRLARRHPPVLLDAHAVDEGLVHPPVRHVALTLRRLSGAALAHGLVLAPVRVQAQSTREQCDAPSARLLGVQATFIGQALPAFHAAYSGTMSLRSDGDHQLSQSYGAYGGACLVRHFAIYVDGEMIRGSGISHASGLAAVTNGDVLRQGSVDLGSGPYIARAFARWTLPLVSGLRDTIVSGADALPGTVSARRVEITAGKFAATDVFDLNRYANSTRTQFLDWVLFNNGAWDYAADTRGYSNGLTAALINPEWTLRAGTFQMPTFANGNRFDGALANARGDNVELTVAAPHDATIRALAYINHARMGRYAVATSKPSPLGPLPTSLPMTRQDGRNMASQ